LNVVDSDTEEGVNAIDAETPPPVELEPDTQALSPLPDDIVPTTPPLVPSAFTTLPPSGSSKPVPRGKGRKSKDSGRDASGTTKKRDPTIADVFELVHELKTRVVALEDSRSGASINAGNGGGNTTRGEANGSGRKQPSVNESSFIAPNVPLPPMHTIQTWPTMAQVPHYG
jgi:hypothetical protein